MKSLKLITALFLIVSCSFLISGMYAGESIDIPLNITNPIYTVTDNSSNLNGLNITYSDGIATIHTNPLMESDNFTIIFLNQEKEIVHKHHHNGGGTNTVTEYKNRTVNNTEYIEIPCNETNQTQKDNETDDKEPKPEKEDDNLFWRWIVFGFVALLLIILILREMRKPAVGSNNQKDERRLNDNGRKEQEETEEE